MLHMLVLGICTLLGLGLLGYWLLNTHPAKLRWFIKWTLITIMAAGAIALLVRGSGSFLWTAALVLLPIFMRWRAIKNRLRNAARTAAGPVAGQFSKVTTSFLEMTLDHDSGTMAGEIISGSFAGAKLQNLKLPDLLKLLNECQSDPQSIQLLENYLDRVHGVDWRASFTNNSQKTEMNREQALEILGLQEGATEESIREAHRRLMLANHPDRGGSTFLATQINTAKEVLLDQIG